MHVQQDLCIWHVYLYLYIKPRLADVV